MRRRKDNATRNEGHRARRGGPPRLRYARGAAAVAMLVGALVQCGDGGHSSVQGPPGAPSKSGDQGASAGQVVVEKETANDLVAAVRARFSRAVAAGIPARPRAFHLAALSSPPPALPATAANLEFVRAGDRLSPRPQTGVSAAGKRPVELSYAAQGNGAFHLAEPRTGLAVDVRLLGAKAVPAEVAAGYVVYRGAEASGGDVLHHVTSEGTEDFVAIDEGKVTGLSYDVALSKAVGGLRLVANVLEFLDAGGAPRLRVAAPYGVDANGRRFSAALSVEGAEVDRDPAPPWRRPVRAPGASHVTVHVDWAGSGAVAPVLVDPAWTSAASMSTGRAFAVVQPLGGRQVLVAGGLDSTATPVGSAEVYDYTTDSWAATGSLGTARYSAASSVFTSMGTTTVCLAGGLDATFTAIDSGECYSTSGATWLATSNNMTTARFDARAVLYTDPMTSTPRVVFIGGGDSNGVALDSVERFDPTSGNGTFTQSANHMNVARELHAATLLADNTILVTGGTPDGVLTIGSAEIYDPIADTPWTLTMAPMATARFAHSQALLSGGTVVIFGGNDGTSPTALTEFYVPGTGFVLPSGGMTASALTTARQDQRSIYLPAATAGGTERILTVGGDTGAMMNSQISAAEIFTPSGSNGTSGAWTTGSSTTVARDDGFGLTLFDTGDVLVVGGDINRAGTVTATSEVFSYALAVGATCATDGDCTSGHCTDGVCCDSACSGGTTDCQTCDGTHVSASFGRAGFCSPLTGGTSCNGAPTGPCNIQDTCGNNDGTCNDNGNYAASAHQVCRVAASPDCDVAEECAGGTEQCPPDVVAPPSTVCRPSADGNTCDPPETCGGANTCPPDVFYPSTHQCHAPGDACDPGSFCSGTSANCPPDVPAPAGTVCRPAVAACDAVEACDGVALSCPIDRVHPVGFVCATDSTGCEVAVCEGTQLCGAPDPANDGLTEGNACMSGGNAGVCMSGACVVPSDGGPAPDAGSAADAGPTDAGSTPDDAGGEDAEADAGSAAGDSGAADVSAPPFDAGAPAPDAGTTDSGVDAGAVDAGARDSGADSGAADSGTDGGRDAGVVDSGGGPVDSGVVDAAMPTDAAASMDAARTPDASPPPDSGAGVGDAASDARSPDSGLAHADGGDAGEEDDGGLVVTPSSSGCSCHTAGEAPRSSEAPLFGVGLGALAVFRLRRRNRRG